MLKKKLKIITLLTVIILSLMLPIVRAEDNIADGTVENESESTALVSEEAEEVSNSGETSAEISNTNDNFKKGDIYLTGDNVTIDYIVDGNLFVFANSVTINSQIGGDAFICAETVNIGEQGYIFSNLFAFAKNVNVSGVVYDLYTAAEEVTINGYIYRDIRVGSNTLNINGTIGRNAFVSAENINFAQSSDPEASLTSKAMINGDFNYTSSKEISIPEGSVSGSSNFTAVKDVESNSKSIQDYIMLLGKFLATVVIIWLVCLWIAPKFLDTTYKLVSKKLLPVLGFGILTPIVIAIAFIILLIIGITSKIALLSLGILLLLITISSSIFVIAMNKLICHKLKIEKTIGFFGMLIVSSVVLWLLMLIPYVGTIISLISSIIGLGILVMSIAPIKEHKKEETIKES